MGEGGLEPPHPFEYWHLKPARLPIPPLARVDSLQTVATTGAAPNLGFGAVARAGGRGRGYGGTPGRAHHIDAAGFWAGIVPENARNPAQKGE